MKWFLATFQPAHHYAKPFILQMFPKKAIWTLFCFYNTLLSFGNQASTLCLIPYVLAYYGSLVLAEINFMVCGHWGWVWTSFHISYLINLVAWQIMGSIIVMLLRFIKASCHFPLRTHDSQKLITLTWFISKPPTALQMTESYQKSFNSQPDTLSYKL